MEVNRTEEPIEKSTRNGMAVFGFWLLSEITLFAAAVAIPEARGIAVGGMLLDALICFALGNSTVGGDPNENLQGEI